MRKVYADVEVTVFLPVKVKGSVVVRVDEGRSPANAIRKLLTNKKCSTADLEDTDLNVVAVGSADVADNELVDADVLQLLGEGWEPKFHRIEVTDSK